MKLWFEFEYFWDKSSKGLLRLGCIQRCLKRDWLWTEKCWPREVTKVDEALETEEYAIRATRKHGHVAGKAKAVIGLVVHVKGLLNPHRFKRIRINQKS